MAKALGCLLGALGLLASFGNAAIPVVDGVVGDGEWENSLVYPSVYAKQQPAEQDRVHVSYLDGTYYFLVQPREEYELIGMVMLINADRTLSTGNQTQAPYGVDYVLDFQMSFDGFTSGIKVVANCGKVPGPAVDPACEATSRSFLIEGDDIALVRGTQNLYQGLEFKIPASRFFSEGGKGMDGDFDFAFEIGVKRYLGKNASNVDEFSVFRYNEPFFSDHWNSFFDLDSIPTCEDTEIGSKVAVVFSDLSSSLFFEDKAYAQLFATMQYQSMQAGIPFDRVTIEDLSDLEVMCQYQAVIIPYAANVYLEDLSEVYRSLFLLRYWYGVGIITTGNFLTNTETSATVPGHPYNIMRELLGIQNGNPVYALLTSNSLEISNNSNVYTHLNVGDKITDESKIGLFTNMYEAYEPKNFESALVTTTVVTQNLTAIVPVQVKDGIHNAVLVNEQEGENMFNKITGRVCHFATLEIAANQDLVWPCIQWVVKLKQPTQFGLGISRFDHIMATRSDCDRSRFTSEHTEIYSKLSDSFLRPMYEKYNFVASYYINVGDDAGRGESTNWDTSKVIYNEWLTLENELGSHSLTHPFNLNKLSDVELGREFQTAIEEIKREMNLTHVYSSQPGANEDLRVALAMEQYHEGGYFSGGYSGLGVGYPGVFGYLNPTSEMVYVAPNYFFDFTMVGFYQYSNAEATAFWKNQILDSTRFARQAIGHWPIHDFGIVNYDSEVRSPSYALGMYSNFIKTAFELNHEFVTVIDLSDRIRALASATVKTTRTAEEGVYRVDASSASGSFGKMTLGVVEPEENTKIASVVVATQGDPGWYAFSDHKVFLPSAGLSAFITTSATGPETPVTRITSLPMRAELVKVFGTGVELQATFYGRGNVTVELNDGAGLLIAGYTVNSSSFTKTSILGRTLVISFITLAEHEFSIAYP